MTRAHMVVGMVVCTLVLGVALPVGAARSPIPSKPNILDPAGDANGTDSDQSTPISVAEADILAGWFTADRKTVSFHWLMAASPLDQGVQLGVRAVKNPQLVESGRRSFDRCLWFTVFMPNPEAGWEPYGYAQDSCTEARGVPGVFETPVISSAAIVRTQELKDGRAIVTVTTKRRSSPLFRRGSVLDHIDASSSIFRRFSPIPLTGNGGFITWDTTTVGRDYRMP